MKSMSIGGAEGNGGASAWSHAEAQEQRSLPASLRPRGFLPDGAGARRRRHGRARPLRFPLRLPTRCSTQAVWAGCDRPESSQVDLVERAQITTTWTLGSRVFTGRVYFGAALT